MCIKSRFFFASHPVVASHLLFWGCGVFLGNSRILRDCFGRFAPRNDGISAMTNDINAKSP
ncbi:hypothetical protein [Campylobacter sp.]|uniref:hypothetical protein n=1 Tax=Campylobacter sp. TaxID=205 RepID=UPI002AA90C6B|nr:hypothetical protein [Campylobacter sp.]